MAKLGRGGGAAGRLAGEGWGVGGGSTGRADGLQTKAGSFHAEFKAGWLFLRLRLTAAGQRHATSRPKVCWHMQLATAKAHYRVRTHVKKLGTFFWRGGWAGGWRQRGGRGGGHKNRSVFSGTKGRENDRSGMCILRAGIGGGRQGERGEGGEHTHTP